MRIYQFHFIDRQGRRPMLDFSDCSDDGDAAREALGRFRLHDSAAGVEVYEGERLVLRMDRPASQAHGAHGIR